MITAEQSGDKKQANTLRKQYNKQIKRIDSANKAVDKTSQEVEQARTDETKAWQEVRASKQKYATSRNVAQASKISAEQEKLAKLVAGETIGSYKVEMEQEVKVPKIDYSKQIKELEDSLKSAQLRMPSTAGDAKIKEIQNKLNDVRAKKAEQDKQPDTKIEKKTIDVGKNQAEIKRRGAALQNLYKLRETAKTDDERKRINERIAVHKKKIREKKAENDEAIAYQRQKFNRQKPAENRYSWRSKTSGAIARSTDPKRAAARYSSIG
jgi:hypothetical protein